MANQAKRKYDLVRIGKSNDQPMGNNSTCVNMIIKERQICSNEINMTKIDEFMFKVDEQMDMSFVLGDNVMDSSGILKVLDEDLTKVDFDHFNMHASDVDYQEYEYLSSNSSQVMGFCFDENLVNDWEMGFGFKGFNVCDNHNYNDGMFLWPWN